MNWAVVAPADSSWESDLVAVLRDLLEHEVTTPRTAEELGSTQCVVLCGDEAWSGSLVSQATAAGTLGRAIVERARNGGLVLAIGEGFAAACRLGLLPGSLTANEPHGFISRMIGLRVEGIANPWAQRAMVGDVWRMPVRTGAGRFTAESAVLDRLERDGLVLLRFLDNPCGAQRDMAAIMSPGRNVLGIIPHPENVVDASLLGAQWPGLDSGRVFFDSISDWVEDGLHRGSFESQR